MDVLLCTTVLSEATTQKGTVFAYNHARCTQQGKRRRRVLTNERREGVRKEQKTKSRVCKSEERR